jgi:hypothetical protein
MADQINIGGMKLNKTTLWISLAAAGGIVGYAWWTRRAAGETPITTEGDVSGIDPATGLPYDSGFGDSGIPTYQGIGVYDPATGGYFGTGYGGQTVTGVSTNAAWVQAATLWLTTQGFEGPAIATALGKVLSGQPVTNDELAIFTAAVGAQGNPPQGYPTIVHVPTGSTPTTPATVGAPKNVKTKTWLTHVFVDFDPVAGAKGYAYFVNGARKTSSVFSQETLWNLKRNTSYRIGIAAIKTDDSLGPTTTVTVRTKK